MTTAAAPGKTKKAAEKPRRSAAVHYLEDLIFEVMLNTGQAAKSREVASMLEETVKLHPKYIRKVLQASERFGQEDRRWNLALRTATQLTFEGSIEYTLRSYGKPMSLPAIQNEMAMIHRRGVEFFDALLTETLAGRPKYWQAPDGAWCLREWLLDTSESDPDRCFLRNFFLEAAEVRPVVEGLADSRMSPDQPLAELAMKFIRRIGEPVSNKVLSYATWRLRDGDLDPVAFFQACRQDPRLLMLSGVDWGLQEFVEGYFEELKRASKRAEKEEDAGWAEEEEPEGPVVLTPTDLEEALKHLRRRKRPQPATALVEALFEYAPASRRFQESVDALVSALSLDSRFVRVGRQTWALPDMMPKHTEKVPDELLPVTPAAREDEVDAELEDEGLEPVLVSWVHDPRYEDFGEESEIEISTDQQPTDELRYVLLYDHWKAGTLKVRVSDRRFYPSDSDLVCANFVDRETRKSYPVWLSYTSSLLYEMGEWYAARKLMPGAVFSVTQGTVPDEFILSVSGESDPFCALQADRIKALVKLGKDAAKEGWSVFQIMQKLLGSHPEGAPFMKLWAEVNVVRRTRRRVVASNLGSYHCFYQKPANSDNWVFDERKLTQGRKKTKRKFVRHT
jgi:DNA-directed RNA polymerase delta subunit